MKIRGKKCMSMFLVLFLVAISGNLVAQVKKGVKIEVETNDGQIVKGELITVKRDSLLLLDAETQVDTSLNINDVKTITVNNKSRMLELGVLGGLIGLAAQGLGGTEVVSDDLALENSTQTRSKSRFLEYSAIFGGVGVLIGAVIGLDKKIQIQGKSDAEIQQSLEKLSKKARVPNIQ
ncbi:MAG: hypothetical protein MUP98_05085 [Candidatus Aminicenantes bacterium]|nr:hypothetical protein [Candidatus Aminicenantes bacterium]